MTPQFHDISDTALVSSVTQLTLPRFSYRPINHSIGSRKAFPCRQNLGAAYQHIIPHSSHKHITSLVPDSALCRASVSTTTQSAHASVSRVVKISRRRPMLPHFQSFHISTTHRSRLVSKVNHYTTQHSLYHRSVSTFRREM